MLFGFGDFEVISGSLAQSHICYCCPFVSGVACFAGKFRAAGQYCKQQKHKDQRVRWVSLVIFLQMKF